MDHLAARRLLLLGGMAAFLVLALAIPRAFADGGAAFGLAYLAVVSVHAGLFTRTSSESAVRAILRIAPFNLASALLVLLAGVSGGAVEYPLWALACALEWVTPRLARISGFAIAPAHFVERHGLVVLIVLGEPVVAVGSYTDSQKATHGFVYDSNTRMFTRIDVPGSTSTVVNGINRLGWLVGFYTDAKKNTVGFVAKPGGQL